MKNFHVNLLIFLALGLCVLCAFQWYAQTAQREAIGTLNQLVDKKNSQIQDDTNSIAVLNSQVEQLDASLTEVKAESASNAQVVATQKAELTRLQFTLAGLTNTVAQYQAAVNTLEAKLKGAYADLEKQNGVITNLVAQRDQFVQKYNDEVKDRNDVVTKYNQLAAQAEKLEKAQAEQKQ